MSRIHDLFNTLSKANLSPMWDENVEQEQILVSTEKADFEIVESAAPGYFGVKKDIPFEEPEYYALDGEKEVLSLVIS